MNWDERAEAVLAQLCLMVPQTLRPLAETAAREESEFLAAERSTATVSDADVIRGWIHVTPPDQRNSLVAVIESLGFDAMSFAEDLESADDWDDEDTESDA